jgi:hypothetical protein
MDLLIKNTIRLRFQDVAVTVPHPSNFAIHKLIISSRRKDDRKERDQNQAVKVLHALVDAEQEFTLNETFAGLPKKWQKTVKHALIELSENKILKILICDSDS